MSYWVCPISHQTQHGQHAKSRPVVTAADQRPHSEPLPSASLLVSLATFRALWLVIGSFRRCCFKSKATAQIKRRAIGTEMMRTRNMTHLPRNLTEGLRVRAGYSRRLLSCPPLMVRPSPFVAALCP